MGGHHSPPPTRAWTEQKGGRGHPHEKCVCTRVPTRQERVQLQPAVHRSGEPEVFFHTGSLAHTAANQRQFSLQANRCVWAPRVPIEPLAPTPDQLREVLHPRSQSQTPCGAESLTWEGPGWGWEGRARCGVYAPRHSSLHCVTRTGHLSHALTNILGNKCPASEN